MQGGNSFSGYWAKKFFIECLEILTLKGFSGQVCSLAALRLFCWRAVQQLPSDMSRRILSSLQGTSFVLLSQLAFENGACLKIYHYRSFLYIQQKVIYVLRSLGCIFTYWCMFLFFICITLSVPFRGGPWTNLSIFIPLLSHTMFFKPRQMAVFLFYIVIRADISVVKVTSLFEPERNTGIFLPWLNLPPGYSFSVTIILWMVLFYHYGFGF